MNMVKIWEWQPTPVFVPGESHRQRSLAGYSPWGHKELDATERLTLTFFIYLFILTMHLPNLFSFFFFFFLFVVNFVIHWNEKALGSQVFLIPIPPPTALPTRSLQVLPEHQVPALVSCIQPGPVICFTLDSIHVSMLFSWNIPPSPYPTESKRLFYKSVSLFLFCI